MKEKITEQSIILFEKKGFSETSIQDIVEANGVTKGTFYYYFSSKEQLLMDIQLRYIEDLLDQQERIMSSTGSDCKTKLYEMIYMLLRNIKTQGASAKIFFREMRNLNEERLSQIIPKRDAFRLRIEQLLREGIEKEEFQEDLNVSIATFGVLGMANWSYQWFSPDGELSEEEIAHIFTEMILKGINK
ncbi:TetR/AcrR family transcriptional regulator [Jeotgalibacillus campisalis]|uniref:TetR family transcriptional regulator n=1 Tax=Jeotgalibacillus campisalis TaxID=220754 RepID=A0A0C2SGJ8_9BACL|nr:TetR/AcrR family transcriptional regulator [Jeotgalibacillus campisalis]KIL53044.1 TetR family transcriptional regulator [Jeotgalibacillus campisalis]